MALAALSPPRKHYWWYCAGREANDNLWRAPQGVHDLLRENFYFKSADSKDNKPFALKSWTASELAKMPRYYIMDLGKGMAETVAVEMPSSAQIAACEWLPEADLRVYGTEYQKAPGALEAMRSGACTQLKGVHFVAGAGHWPAQEQPQKVNALLIEFLRRVKNA